MARSVDIQLVVITPERQVLEEATSSVVFAAHDGELGVLHNRAPLMCELGIGQLRYESGGRSHRVYIDGGFAQVYENHVTVLTQQAIPEEEVTPDKIAAVQRSLDGLRGMDAETVKARRLAQQRLRAMRGVSARA